MTVIVGGSGNDTLNGGSGDDSIYGGGGNDTLNGNGGNDILSGDAGSDTLNGGDGNDIIYFDEADISGGQVRGGLGFDWLFNATTGTPAALLSINMATLEAEGYYGGVGTEQVDASGVSVDVNLNGNGGNDQLTGGSGNDTLIGGDGNDTLNGGLGVDLLLGGDGNDTLSGGDGNDILFGDAGSDTLSGGNGADFIYFDEADLSGGQVRGGAGVDWVFNATTGTPSSLLLVSMATLEAEGFFGGAGAELVDASGVAVSVNLNGNAGNDQLIGGSADDLLIGGDGNDSLVGGIGADLLLGGNGNDTLAGGDGADTLSGDAGSDTLSGGDGNDFIYFDEADLSGGQVRGGVGFDWLFNVTTGTPAALLSVNMSTLEGEGFLGGSGAEQVDASGVSVSVNLNGNDGNDELTGGSGDDLLIGGNGNDVLTGNVGADLLIGGSGNDTLTGGDGIDTLSGDAGSDTLNGGDGADLIFFDEADISGGQVRGGAGFDWLFNVTGAPSALLSVNMATLESEGFVGGSGAEVVDASGVLTNVNLNGNGGDDQLIGGAGDDLLIGLDGNDILTGGVGGDVLLGGDGADTLTGGSGNDTLRGGIGIDRFVFGTGWGVDNIVDFENGIDKLDMSVTGLTSFSQLSISQNGADALIGYGGGWIILTNTSASLVDISDFTGFPTRLRLSPVASATSGSARAFRSRFRPTRFPILTQAIR